MVHLLRKYDVARCTRNDAMFAIMGRKAHIIRVANIIGRSPASFAEGKHHSKNAPLSVDKSVFFVAKKRANGA